MCAAGATILGNTWVSEFVDRKWRSVDHSRAARALWGHMNCRARASTTTMAGAIRLYQRKAISIGFGAYLAFAGAIYLAWRGITWKGVARD